MKKRVFKAKAILLLFSTQLLFSFFALAEKEKSRDSGHPLASTAEREIQDKARKRNYRGGKDEEPLAVQVQLPTTSRKMGASEEAPPEPAASDD